MKSDSSARRLLQGFLAALLLLVGVDAAAAAPGQVRAELLSEVSEVAAGEPFWVGMRLRMQEGWHTYWRNPGDSGLPSTIEWNLPDGFEAGEILWPAPERFLVGPVANLGYEGEVVLLTEITPPTELEAGTAFTIGANANWLSCEEECIPGSTESSVQLRAAAGESVFDSRSGPIVAEARTKLPAPPKWKAAFHRDADTFTLRIDEISIAGDRIESAFFFPFLGTVVEHAAAQEASFHEAGLSLRLQASSLAPAELDALEGVLVLREVEDGAWLRRAYEIRATPSTDVLLAGAAAPSAAIATDVPPMAAAAPSLGVLQVLFFALLGGIILNLMPCVFPVLSLKVLSVVQQAAEEPRRVRLHGLAYTAGILVSFALVAGVLIALRAGGAQIGWGFQLQSPIFVAILAYVIFAMGLSLSGVVEFGGSVMGVGSSLASRSGLSGSFFTGVLATVVATPCTAPFMGAAVGFALTQPAWVGLVVFLALGLGLALPFLALSFIPAAHRLLPRPGAWMETLKQALAFPLYATVAWLVWVLQQQAGSLGLAAALAGLVLVGLAAWAYGASRRAGTTMKRVGTAVAAIAVVGSLALARFPDGGAGPAIAAGAGAANKAEPEAEPFSEERLNELLAEGRPVFVNFTAAWCVTCLVNEQNALSTRGVRDSLAEKGVTYLKGDWTNEDPEITRMLERFGRSGVPLYLVYGKGSPEPTILPQILTESMVVEQLKAL